MLRSTLAGLLWAIPAIAMAQCNTVLPGSCAPNDPVLFGIQQQQQNELLKRQEINNQNLKLQQIERDNMRRYQTPTRPALRQDPGGYSGSSSLLAPDPPPRRVRAKARRHHAPVHRGGTRRHR